MENDEIAHLLTEGLGGINNTLLSFKDAIMSVNTSLQQLAGDGGVIHNFVENFKDNLGSNLTDTPPMDDLGGSNSDSLLSISESLRELTHINDTLFAVNDELESATKINTLALIELTNALISSTKGSATSKEEGAQTREGEASTPDSGSQTTEENSFNLLESDTLRTSTKLSAAAGAQSKEGEALTSDSGTSTNAETLVKLDSAAGAQTREGEASTPDSGTSTNAETLVKLDSAADAGTMEGGAPTPDSRPPTTVDTYNRLHEIAGGLPGGGGNGGNGGNGDNGDNGDNGGNGGNGAIPTGGEPDDDKGFMGKMGDSLIDSLGALGSPQQLALEAGLKLAKMAIEKLTETLHEMNEISERLSIINTDLNKELIGNTESLEKNTVGFGLAVKALAELRVAGFDKTNANLINLATRTKISGQDFGAVVKLGQDIIATGSHQEDVMDGLSKSIVDNSLKYGTTTDSMVKAVSQLSENFQLLSVMGGLDTATGVTADITARLGQENSQLVGSLMKELTSANSNLNMQAILGVEGLGDMLAMGNIDTQEAIQGIIEGSKNAARLQGAAANTSRRALAATFGGTDKFLTNLRIVGEKLENAQKPAIEMWDGLKKTLTVFKEIVMDPLKNVAMGLLKPFQLLIKGLSLLVGSIMNLIIRALGPVIAIAMDIVGVVAGAIGFVIQGIAAVFEQLYDILSMIPGIGRWFKDADSDENSTFKSMNKLLESMNGIASDSLALDSADARNKEKDLLTREKTLDGLDIWREAALADVDYKLRRMEESKQEMLTKVLTKLLEQGDDFKGKDIVSSVKEVTAALIGTQVNPFATGNI